MTTETKPSEGAMRLAMAIEVRLAVPITTEKLAALIDKETRQDWIPCSERMPTEADGDECGNILVYHQSIGKEIRYWETVGRETATTHWLPLLPTLGATDGN